MCLQTGWKTLPIIRWFDESRLVWAVKHRCYVSLAGLKGMANKNSNVPKILGYCY